MSKIRIKGDTSGYVDLETSATGSNLSIGGNTTVTGTAAITGPATISGPNNYEGLIVENTATDFAGGYMKIRDGNSTAGQYTWIGRNSDVTYIQSSNSNVAMQFTNAGIVQKPNHPYAYASSQTKATATAKIQLDFGHYSGGGITIDQTNERMTVPVAGLYAIGFTQLTDVAAYVECYIKINGTIISGSRAQTGTSHQYGELGTKIIIQLQANDYAEFWCGAGTTHNNVGYNIHYVYLIG